jgi:hypothetical protein
VRLIPLPNFNNPPVHGGAGVPGQPLGTSRPTSRAPVVATPGERPVAIFGGQQQHLPDSGDPVVVNHWVWYEATGYTRPYPGEVW